MVAGPDNVVARGADPTGVSDSAAAINTAIGAGGLVYIPAGVYRIDSSLNALPRGTVVMGEGRGDPQVSGQVGTVLKGNSLSGPMFQIDENHCQIRDLQIQDAGTGIELSASSNRHSNTFQRLKITGCTRGIHQPDTSSNVFYRTTLEDIIIINPLNGVEWSGRSDITVTRMDGVHIVGLQSGGRGFKMDGYVGGEISSCSVIDVSDTSAYALEFGSQSWSVSIIGFLFQNNDCGVLTQVANGNIGVHMHGGLIDTDGNTASSPVLFDINGGDFVAFGLHVKGAENYTNFMADSGTVRFVEPKPNITTLPGFPAGAKVLYDGTWVQ